MADADAMAVADLTVCTGMPILFFMSLYTPNPLVNEKQTRFSFYHYTTFGIGILVMPSYG